MSKKSDVDKTFCMVIEKDLAQKLKNFKIPGVKKDRDKIKVLIDIVEPLVAFLHQNGEERGSRYENVDDSIVVKIEIFQRQYNRVLAIQNDLKWYSKAQIFRDIFHFVFDYIADKSFGLLKVAMRCIAQMLFQERRRIRLSLTTLSQLSQDLSHSVSYDDNYRRILIEKYTTTS